jgi:hypothetical protein
MRVKDIITQLQAYDPEEEVAVAYWDRETVDSYANEEFEVSDELWVKIVERYENGEWGWQSWAADTFVDIFHDLKLSEPESR